MNQWVIRGVVAVVFLGGGCGISKVIADQNNEDKNRKNDEENERLRKNATEKRPIC